MVVELQQGRSEHNYARSEMCSVIIHHAVSGCFACRKIICFNLPSFQTHTEHHILCKKVTLGGTIELTIAVPLLLKGVFFVFPTPSLTKSILGIPFQQNVLKYFCLKGEVLATHSFSSYPAATQRSLFPPAHMPLSITAFLLCCRHGEMLQCREVTSRMQSFSFPPTWTI